MCQCKYLASMKPGLHGAELRAWLEKEYEWFAMYGVVYEHVDCEYMK